MSGSLFEDEVIELIIRVEAEEKEAAQRLEDLKRERGALQQVLKSYRARHILPPLLPLEEEPLQTNSFKDKSYREILVYLASKNRGYLKGKEAIRQMKQAGIFPKPDHAGGIIYSVLNRCKEFTKIKPGIYKLVTEVTEEDSDVRD